MAVVPNVHRLILVAACAGLAACGASRSTAQFVLPSSPELLVEAFLQAANDNSVARMETLWGDADGPSNVSNKIPAPERERRLTIMQRLLRNDTRRLTALERHNEAVIVNAEIVQGGRRFTVPFTCVAVRGGWLVRDIGLEAAMPQAGPRTNN